MTVVRTDFATDDPAQAEELIRRTYVDQRLALPAGTEAFAFAHRSVGVTGPGTITVNRLRHSTALRFAAEAVDDLLITDAVGRGSVGVHDDPDFDDVAAGPGEVLLTPPSGRFGSLADRADIVLTVLRRSEVAAHAAARIGIEAGALRFTGLAPVDARIGSLWIGTVEHVRDAVLTHDDLLEEPLVLESTHRLLSTALLATFPNTALEALRDPRRGPGAVGAASADRAVDFLRAHAHEPVRPADVAARAGAPTRDVDAALRRRRNTTLAAELWRARLRGAHGDLRVGDPAAGDTVAAIAARWGFTHPARFAVAYTMATGGETPNDTLHC